MSASPAARFRENVTGITSVIVTGIWLAGLFTGQSWWLAALLVGYVVVVPIVAVLFGDEDDVAEWWDEDDDVSLPENREEPERAAEVNNLDALETLRDRYARGELTDEQFERKLDRLLETESLEDVADRAREREAE